MQEKQKACPQCGSEMSYRLGMFECLQCGHEEEDQALAAPPTETSGAGFRRESWQRPGPPTAGQQPLTPTGTVYTPGVAPAAGLYRGYGDTTTSSYPTLDTEKKIVFSIQTGCGILEVIAILFGGISAQAGGAVVLNLVSNLIGLALGLWLLWYVLFESPLWLKQACCATQGCSIIGVIVLLLMATSPSLLDALRISRYDYGLYIVVVWVLLLPQLLWNGWIMFILYRDIQQMR